MAVLGVHWKDWCWSWNSNTLATSCEELTHWKRHWCWERLRAGGEGDDGRWDGWMASPTQWTQVWVTSGSWWWTGRPGVLQSMGSQRVGHNWATQLNWTEKKRKERFAKNKTKTLGKDTIKSEFLKLIALFWHRGKCAPAMDNWDDPSAVNKMTSLNCEQPNDVS